MKMDKSQIDPFKLYVDGLTLVYHEARNVRFLIKEGYIERDGWERLTSLPRNRIEAWRDLQQMRRAGRSCSKASSAAELFAAHFSQSIIVVQRMYENSNWKDAAAVGGHAWRKVANSVSSLGHSLEDEADGEIPQKCYAILEGRHNTGFLRDKILGLDLGIGVNTDPWWFEPLSDS